MGGHGPPGPPGSVGPVRLCIKFKKSNFLLPLEHSSSQNLKLHLSFLAKRPKEDNVLFGIREASFSEQSIMHAYCKSSGILLSSRLSTP